MERPGFLNKFLTEEELSTLRLSAYAYQGITFVRSTHDHGRYPRGTVFHDGGVVFGYPRIMRILHLGRGISRHFGGGFYAEEKVDGYNVRVCLADGRPIAFTRGGFVCPFTTKRLPDLLPDLRGFFSRYPDLVICGEVVGPESPYNTEAIPYIGEDVRFFAFEGGTQSLFSTSDVSPFLTAEEKYALYEREGIPMVRRWGPFMPSDMDKVKELVLALDREEREGIVLKPDSGRPEMGKFLKFVTLSSCLRDIEAASPIMAELPAGFFIQRITRAVFFSHEFGIPLGEDYLLRAARALYLENIRLLDEMEEGGEVKESFRIRVKERETVDALMGHLRHAGVRAEISRLEEAEGRLSAVFRRTYKNGTRRFRRMLRGHGFYD
jgi:putative ATP-dependent DNA ligase